MDLSSINDMHRWQHTLYRREHGIKLHDAVHGERCLGPLAKQLLKTSAVQILRRKHQLGASHYVFPTAVHTRHEHSIGTACLAVEQLEHLCATGLQVNPRIIELLEVAGLCHDLGHGPFSHAFESKFLPAAGIKDWEHEHMSAELLQYTVDKYNIAMTQEEVQFVQGVINGSSTSSLVGEEQWMFQIVANSLNSIDVDKIDYLLRDSQMAGVKPVWDFTGLLRRCKVVDDEICFQACHQVQDDVAGLYAARASMHRKVYQHVDTVAAEFMVVDAMIAAEPVLNITKDIHNPEGFLLWDDTVLGEIRRRAARDTQDRNLQRAAAVLQRLESGDVYPLAAEVVVPTEFVSKNGEKSCKMEAADIVAHQDSNSIVQLHDDDIRVQSVIIHHCKKGADPLESVRLYDSSGSTRPASQGMTCRPAFFMDCQVRVYLAKDCQGDERAAYTKAIQTAVLRAVKHRFGHQHPWSTLQSDESAYGIGARFLQHTPAAAPAVSRSPAADCTTAAAAAAAAAVMPLELHTPDKVVPAIVQQWSPQVAPRQLYTWQLPQQMQKQRMRGIKRRPDGGEYVPASDDEDEMAMDDSVMETQPSQLSQLEPAPQRLQESVLQ